MAQNNTRTTSRDEQIAVHTLALLAEHMPDPLREYIKRLASDPAFDEYFYFAWQGRGAEGFLVDWFNSASASSDHAYVRRSEALADIALYGYESDDYREGMPSTGLWEKCFDAHTIGWVRMLAEAAISERTMSEAYDYGEAYEAGVRSPEIDAALGRGAQSTHPAGARNAHLTELLVELPMRLLEIQANRQTEYFRRYDMRSWHDIVEEYAHS